MDIQFNEPPETRYDRHQLISWWDQALVARSRFLVVGAGALGNEALKLLALIGAGQIQVVDFDVVSRSNLSRMVLFRESDIGQAKTAVAARRIAEINPEVEVIPVQGDLRYHVGLGDYRAASIVLGCLDSLNARWALNRRCQRAGVGWIDAGISDYHGLVAHYAAGEGACYECTFSASSYARFNQRYSCPFGFSSDQPAGSVPTTALTTSAIAAMQVQQALMVLHHMPEALQPGERAMLYLKPFLLTRDRLPFNPNCLAHDPLPPELPRVSWGRETNIAQAIQYAREIDPAASELELGFDLVLSLTCPVCHTQEKVLRPRDQVIQSGAFCPQCRQERQPEVVDRIGFDHPLAGHRLGEIGIPPREILSFRSAARTIYLQIA